MGDHSEKIQDYIKGQLQGAELNEFEAQLVIDSDLRNMLFLQKEVNAILNTRIVSQEIESRRDCRHSFSNFRHETEDFKMFQSDFIWMISAFVLLLVVGVIFFTFR